MSEAQKRIDSLFHRLQNQKSPTNLTMSTSNNGGLTPARPSLPLGGVNSSSSSPIMPRPRHIDLPFVPRQNDNAETERKLKEIMQISGNLTINGVLYKTDIKDMEDLEELGNGTCGHVVKMAHKHSGEVIAVKQMRRSGNSDETKRIIMDIEVVLKSHDCKYIVHCLGCFITESEVWICMELMDTCFDKLLKKFKQSVPEEVLGKVTVATVEALSYLKDKHGVIHRDVKPSNILLDLKGNVKLCDFGISGRLVDSMAKTRSAGCAAYMAPERIEPDPQNPDYDVRADVWSLGITLVELATGAFPYQDCKTDFEVLAKVIGQDPPSLPMDKDFSPEFREFVACCLKKDKKHRPKYAKLKNHPFIKKHETVSNVSVREWYVRLIRNAEEMTNRVPPRQNLSTIRQIFSKHRPEQQPPPIPAQPPPTLSSLNLTNGSAKDLQASAPPDRTDYRVPHTSRLSSFQRSNSQQVPTTQQSEFPYQNSSTSHVVRSYSPYQAYQNHLASLKDQSVKSTSQKKTCYSPLLPRRSMENSTNNPSYLQHRRVASETRWRSPSSSPLQLRSQYPTEESHYNLSNASPMILQRFYHQQKQQQMVKEAEESGKTRFASYIKMQLSGDSGRSSRHQSPEPPPRLNRRLSSENQSPLAVRRNIFESQGSNSPSLSRRYISPTPPVPPPRKLSESTSVPGSPQHLRSRFHYTPEPQRRLFQNNDVS